MLQTKVRYLRAVRRAGQDVEVLDVAQMLRAAVRQGQEGLLTDLVCAQQTPFIARVR